MTSETNPIGGYQREPLASRFGGNIERLVLQDAKQGGTGTFGARAGADSWINTVAASQTGADGVFHIPGLCIGDKIVGYHLIGQIESAGNEVTVDAKIVKMTAVAADVTTADAAGTSMTQLSASADTVVSASNAKKEFDEAQQVVVEDGNTYCVVVTVTTGASTDLALQAVVLYVERARAAPGV